MYFSCKENQKLTTNDKNTNNTHVDKHILNPEKWVQRYADYLYSYAFFKLPSKEAAEDVVQETFLSAYISAKNFKGNSTEKTWLVSILKRKIVDYYRKKARNKEDNLSQYQLPFYESGDYQNHWLEARAPKDWAVDNQIELNEFHQILQICLQLLPPKHRVVFIMKVLDECDSNEICEKEGIRPGNLWTIMHRARLQVRECMEKKWLQNEI